MTYQQGWNEAVEDAAKRAAEALGRHMHVWVTWPEGDRVAGITQALVEHFAAALSQSSPSQGGPGTSPSSFTREEREAAFDIFRPPSQGEKAGEDVLSELREFERTLPVETYPYNIVAKVKPLIARARQAIESQSSRIKELEAERDGIHESYVIRDRQAMAAVMEFEDLQRQHSDLVKRIEDVEGLARVVRRHVCAWLKEQRFDMSAIGELSTTAEQEVELATALRDHLLTPSPEASQ